MRFLKYYLAIHLLVGLTFIVLLQLYFHYPASVAILHLLLLFSILSIALLPCLYWLQSKNKLALTLYCLVAFPLLDSTIFLLYSSTVISNITWSGNITLQLAGAYIGDLSVMRQTLPVLNVYIAVLVIVLMGTTAIYSLLFSRYFKIDDNKFQLKLCAYPALAALASAQLLQIGFDREDPGMFSGEPISNLFLDYIPHFAFDPAERSLDISNVSQNSNPASEVTSSKQNVIIIMVDALRADHLKPYGYHRDTSPFLSRLHDEGQLLKIDTVHSTCSESACGIMSVLAGKEYHDIRSNSGHLGDTLRSYGYTSSFLLTGNHAWSGLRTMYNADYIRDGEMRENFAVNDDAGLIDDLNNLDLAANEANFLYFHLYSAHDLGLRHRQFNEYEPFRSSYNPIAALFSTEEIRVQQIINNYDNGILQADYFIAQIFRQLERQGVLENSIIYITSDHGQAFGEHGHFGHTRFLYEEHTRIPLFIYDPLNFQSYQNTQYATHTDIVPTILDTLDLAANTELTGRSMLLPEPANRITRHSTTTINGWKMNLIKRGDQLYKHLWEGESYDARSNEQMFNLKIDPKETNNILDQSQDIVELTTMRRE